ncbi:phage portal protein [Sphingomonas sp. T9W2]|uniref:phage portal protein n=1 Tax=Sphingomonas sp. T9W2 TaxID=3143183 RepID=UPI0031F50614
MTGYTLSARAAALERQWNAARLAGKDIEGLESFVTGRSDRDNLVTNRITTEAYDDVRFLRRSAALGLSATWACVSFWAGNIASLPIYVQRPGPGGVAINDTSHPLHELLHDSPNYDQSAFDFWEFMAASIELHGNAYAEMFFGTGGNLIALEPILCPDRVQVRRLSNRDLEYRWTADSRSRIETQQRILHVRGFGGSALGGVSPLAVCRATFDTATSVDRAAAKTFINGVQPSGVLSTERILTASQRKELEDLLVEKFVGARNAGRPMLLDNKLSWQQLSINPVDAEMLESRRFSVEDICRVFEVDPHLVGQAVGNTTLGSSITEQTNSVMKFKMRKRLKRMEGALGKQLLSRADRRAGFAIRFNVEAFLRADSVGRANFYDKMKPFMTINEVRALEGWAPVPGGDAIYRQMQDVALGDPTPSPEKP